MKTLTVQLDDYGKRTVMLRVPEIEDVENLKVGDEAPNCFGGMATVTRIYALSKDIHGAAFVCYYCAMSERDTVENCCGCSMSMKVGELMRTVAATGAFISADLDTVETFVKSGSPLPAYLARGSRRAA